MIQVKNPVFTAAALVTLAFLTFVAGCEHNRAGSGSGTGGSTLGRENPGTLNTDTGAGTGSGKGGNSPGY
jgi:hypothetical protein